MSPLDPEIKLEDRRGLTVCNTCGVDDGTVRLLRFGRHEAPTGQMVSSTAVALCAGCRGLTARALGDARPDHAALIAAARKLIAGLHGALGQLEVAGYDIDEVRAALVAGHTVEPSDWQTRMRAALAAGGCSSVKQWVAHYPGVHCWFRFGKDDAESCASCGVVRRRDDQNKPCVGIVKVAPRTGGD